MTRDFTDHDLIRFLYHETTTEESKSIKELAASDPEFGHRLSVFRIVVEAFEPVSKSPSPSSIEIIMNYSKKMEEPLQASW